MQLGKAEQFERQREAVAVDAGDIAALHEAVEHAVELVGTAAEPFCDVGLREAAIHPGPLPPPTTPASYKLQFRLLRDGLTQWMNGVLTPKGMPSYDAFVEGVTSALDHVRKHHTGNVLLVSSGGPISTAIGHILGTLPEKTIELNMQIRNSAVTEFLFTPKRHLLLSFNALAHLDGAEYAPWITYS